MRKKTSKSPKLRDITCTICGKIFQDRKSPAEIAKNKNITCSKKCLIETQRQRFSGEIKNCQVCGKEIRASKGRILRGWGKYCSKRCQFANSVNISLDGYKTKRVKGKITKLHRTIYENYYGVKLTSQDIIHHIDGNKLNNEIDNLKLMTRAEHNKLHFTKNNRFQSKRLFAFN